MKQGPKDSAPPLLPAPPCPEHPPAGCQLGSHALLTRPQIKNGISHRYRALDKLRAYLLDGHAAAAGAGAAAGGQQ